LAAAGVRVRATTLLWGVEFTNVGRKASDPIAAPAAEFVGRIVCRGSSRVVGTVDASGGSIVAGRRTVGSRLPGARETASAEPHAWATADASRSSPAHADPETRAQLELRDCGAGSTRQRGVPEFLPDWPGASAGCKDAVLSRVCGSTRTHIGLCRRQAPLTPGHQITVKALLP